MSDHENFYVISCDTHDLDVFSAVPIFFGLGLCVTIFESTAKIQHMKEGFNMCFLQGQPFLGLCYVI